jgi:hypothetical protein
MIPREIAAKLATFRAIRLGRIETVCFLIAAVLP